MSLIDSKQDLLSGNPLHHAPPWQSDQSDRTAPATAEHEKKRKAWPAPRIDNVARSLFIGERQVRNRKPPDIFAEALAQAEREQLEREQVEMPVPFPGGRSGGIVTKLIIAVAAAALVALICVIAVPAPEALIEDIASWGVPQWQALSSTLFPAPPHRRAPALMVRDNSGPINEPLELGVRVDAPAPGATVMVRGLPPSARLTAGKKVSASEWRVPAQEISGAAITPPTDFIGEINLSAELRGTDEAALVTSFVRLTWTAPRVRAVIAATPAETAPPVVLASEPPQLPAPAPPAAAAAAPPPAAEEPVQQSSAKELTPNEIAGLVRRAQELMANGDLQAARAQLMRAAEARDARAALLLAKTFDPKSFEPIAAKQSRPTEPVSDVAQARNWYQRAREWGSPEAQRQLDALASYPRR